MTPKEVIKYYGSRDEVLELLDIKRQSLDLWLANGRVPLGRQYELQILTDGQLVAGKKKANKNG
ncbi:unnamed protein product [marine sediment metagenome]|uniref:DNA-binding protein n=1 Tax=marine sediment metagenome TaxID=412755 RepID=X0ZHU9_9ZZZZ